MSDNKILELLKELKSHKWVDLTHEFGPDSPHFPLFKPAEFKTIFTHEDGFFVKEYTFAGQYGTHIDPPVHFEKEKPIFTSIQCLKNDCFLISTLTFCVNNIFNPNHPDK